ncbi:hypothetical protein [Glutamicibacter nicotianae]|uniref:hypothetical protein n=1 Tax=Glutamicibacter nicotianae TaxID=37929 RepID=UPI001958E3DD|nr:hypothetical protein [Glutamicibacter nicotianae]MBM7768248.1 hypothetical protein [Glutamicibacter nicotianae]
MTAIKEKTYFGRKYKISYKFRPSRIDKRKLLVVFSGGFGTKKYYDFDGPSSESVKCNILWIRDMFDGNFTYYIRDNSGFAVENDVQDLISYFIRHLGITKRDVILAGFSKGASAALYHGTKHDYRNIIATVPRIKLGSANVKRPEIFRGLSDDDSAQAISHLDSLIPNAISRDQILDKNIYLYSSPQDPLFEGELKEHLNLFRKYENFNFVLTESDLVRRHRDVTRYNLPNIIAIMNLLIDDIIPKFGITKNGNRDYSGITMDPASLGEHLLKTETVKIKDEMLHLSGYAFFRGVQPRDEVLRNNLVLRNESDETFIYGLAHKTDPYLSYIHYQSKYIDYDRGAFTTRKNLGISLSDLPTGHYRLEINSSQLKYESNKNIEMSKLKISWSASEEYLNCLYLDGTQVKLRRVLINATSENDAHHLTIATSRLDNGVLNIRGQLAFCEAASGEPGNYYRYRMVLSNTQNGRSILVPLKRLPENLTVNEMGQEVIYPNASFSISRMVKDFIVDNGTYSISIGLLAQNNYHVAPTDLRLVVHENTIDLLKFPSRRKR